MYDGVLLAQSRLLPQHSKRGNFAAQCGVKSVLSVFTLVPARGWWLAGCQTCQSVTLSIRISQIQFQNSLGKRVPLLSRLPRIFEKGHKFVPVAT